jgi:hypothetical protein
MIPGIVASGQLIEVTGGHGAPTVFSVEGGWSWFSDPRAIVIGDGMIVGAIHGADGDLVAYGMRSTTPVELFDAFVVDDHGAPTFLRRSSDGKILACASGHDAPGLRVWLSTNPDDPSAFGAATNIDAQVAGSEYTYTNPIQLTDETDDPIYLFIRSSDGTDRHFYYTKSTDQGANWANQVKVFSFVSGTVPPYVKVVQNGNARIDFFMTDGHPNEIATNNIYHCYYEAGDFHETDGTTATLPIVVNTDLTPLYSGATDHAWIWDAAIDGLGNPVCVFATFPSVTDHRYHYRKWDGVSAWDGAQICTAGRFLTTAEQYYSGGVAIDPDNVNIVFASREVDDEHQLWRFVTADDGATWDAGEQITMGPRAFRPYVIRGAAAEPRLLYMAGNYHDFDVFGTEIKLIDSDTAEVTLPTDAQHADTCLICNFHEPAGTTEATDYSPDARALTFRDGADISAVSTAWGVSSCRFDGTSDAVTAANHADFQFGAADFTVECVVALDDWASPANDEFLVSLWRSDNNTRSWGIRVTSSGNLEGLGSTDGTAVTVISSASVAGLTDGSWHHVAWKRVSGVFTLWVDGSQVDSDTTAFTFFAGTSLLAIGNIMGGATTPGTTSCMTGYHNGVRITLADRTITNPTAAFPIS